MAAAGADFTFVQISDSHIGFNKDANNNVIGTLQEAINRIKALPTKPDLIIHTGDLTHLAEADEFDTVDQALKGTGVSDIFYVPGEHDVLNDNGEQYRNRFAKGTNGDGWYSFTHRGVHFVGLVNVMGKAENALGSIGARPIVLAGKRPRWSLNFHADYRICSRTVMGDLPSMGLGNSRWGDGFRVFETVRFGVRAKWSHPSNRPEGGRKYFVPYRHVDSVPTTRAWYRT